MKESDSQPNESQEKSGPPQLGGEEVSNLSTVVLHRNDSGGGGGGVSSRLAFVLDLHLTSLRATMVASGMGLWFCLAMRLRVFMALAVRPDRMSKRGLSGSHCVTRRRLGPPLPLFWGHPSIADGPTLAEMRKIPTGVADSPSSHLQPRVGITSSANTISNVEPKPQNSWSTQKTT